MYQDRPLEGTPCGPILVRESSHRGVDVAYVGLDVAYVGLDVAYVKFYFSKKAPS